MKTLILELPEQADEKKTRTFIAAKLYESGDLSLGQAAQLAGYTKSTFMELLADFGVSIFNYTADDLAQEIAHVKDNHR